MYTAQKNKVIHSNDTSYSRAGAVIALAFLKMAKKVTAQSQGRLAPLAAPSICFYLTLQPLPHMIYSSTKYIESISPNHRAPAKRITTRSLP